jgi:hypothetical protein
MGRLTLRQSDTILSGYSQAVGFEAANRTMMSYENRASSGRLRDPRPAGPSVKTALRADWVHEITKLNMTAIG